jgi:pyrroline-5-carboxylate reductase
MLCVVGGGNMGEALVAGLIDAHWAPTTDIAVVEILPARRDQLTERFPSLYVSDRMPPCHAALIAVKPGDVPAAVRNAVAAGARRLLSIAAGVTIATIEAAAGPGVAVVRAMPNTPALVRAGAAAITPGSHATNDDLGWAESILSSVGMVVRVPEHLLDAVTGLAGSGPAYLFMVAEALIDAGVLVGLPRPAARALVTQLFVGSAKLMAESGDLPEVLRANVTSPGGTTAAGLRELERHALRGALIAAVEAATERGRQLGGSRSGA